MNKKKETSEMYKVYIKTSTIGLEVGLSIVAGVVAGYFVDRYFHIGPWGFLVGLFVGVLAAGKRLYMFVKKYQKEEEDEARGKKPDA